MLIVVVFYLFLNVSGMLFSLLSAILEQMPDCELTVCSGLKFCAAESRSH